MGKVEGEEGRGAGRWEGGQGGEGRVGREGRVVLYQYWIKFLNPNQLTWISDIGCG